MPSPQNLNFLEDQEADIVLPLARLKLGDVGLLVEPGFPGMIAVALPEISLLLVVFPHHSDNWWNAYQESY